MQPLVMRRTCNDHISLSSPAVLFLSPLGLIIVRSFGQLSTIYADNLFSRSLFSLFTLLIESVQTELFDVTIPENLSDTEHQTFVKFF